VVAYRSSTITTYASRTNTVATAPTGIADGDALFLFVIEVATSPPAITPPSGFSLLPNFPYTLVVGTYSVKTSAFVKIASGESGSYTITHASTISQAYLAAFSAPAFTPFSPNPTVNSATGGPNTTTMLGLTTTTNNSLVMTISQDWGDTTNNLTPPSGSTPTFTERGDASILEVADGILATAGATGNKTMTNNCYNNNTNSGWSGFMFAMPAFTAPQPFTIQQAVNRSYTY